jgi:hypothetical protein
MPGPFYPDQYGNRTKDSKKSYPSLNVETMSTFFLFIDSKKSFPSLNEVLIVLWKKEDVPGGPCYPDHPRT